MEARKKRNIKSGEQYDDLFPKSENGIATIKRNANLYHTVDFIPKVVHQTLEQTKPIARLLKANTTYETCRNIWRFVYEHINYKKDQEGYEQIRSPARSWHDRKTGVDCDCYTVFISSILMNLGIPHILRITKYHRDWFQHIYPIVPASPGFPSKGKEIVIDCVTDKFDYQVPYSEKKDYPMDLQYLNGFDGDGMEELGKVLMRNMAKGKKPTLPKTKALSIAAKVGKGLLKKLKSKAANKSNQTSTPGSAIASMPAVKKKKKGFLKKALNVVNKVNPATVLLRNGVLAIMKLNIKNVAARLRWSYLTPEQAIAKGMDPEKYQRLVATRQKLEKIFYGAGGKESNLKKAILGGKGNKDKAVSGLGMLPSQQWSVYMNASMPLEQLLGPEIYYSENVAGMAGFRGFGQLGEPVTFTSIGAAMGVVAGIVAALKQIGDVFKNKQPGSEDFDESKTDAPENNVNIPVRNASTPSPVTNSPELPENMITPGVDDGSNNVDNTEPTPGRSLVKPVESFTSASTSPGNSNTVIPMDDEATDVITSAGTAAKTSEAVTTSNTGAAASTANTDADADSNDKAGFWKKNKKWIKPVAIGVGGLTLIAIGFKLMNTGKHEHKPSSHLQGLDGVPMKKRKKRKSSFKPKQQKKTKHYPKKAVALL